MCIYLRWSDFAETAGVDLNAVISAIRDRPTQKYNGAWTGGWWLLLDRSASSKLGIGDAFQFRATVAAIERAVSINDRMPLTSYGIIEAAWQCRCSNCSVRVTYRGDVADTRSAPFNFLWKPAGKGAKLAIYDPLARPGLKLIAQLSRILNGSLRRVLTCWCSLQVINHSMSKVRSR